MSDSPAIVAGRPALDWSGLLPIDKPLGMTSHDVVERVRRRLKAPHAGHLGTLDPGATGLLLVAIGAATRCSAVWQGGDKTYDATLLLGVVTDTQDLRGQALERRDVRVDEAQVREASRAFVGDIRQVPPMVSALKVGGQRLYKLARRGEEVARVPRRIRVAAWEWLAFQLPRATFRVRCSSGTYVRTLAHDLGQALGCGAALESLRRLRSEPYDVEQAPPLRLLDELPREQVLADAGIPLDRALDVLPAVNLDAMAAENLGFGRQPAVAPGAVPVGAGPRSVVLRGPDGHALALGELRPHPHDPMLALACPHVVFPWAVREGGE
ncbi:MAG TPA: tRNA pseudouridine(55) synthase TruB [Candidatus Eisenbacteria bacterium]|nr:tRNA pseudouridine(55) synthase TruB [Candidatus Eisenbacteria bacterium]